MLLGAGSLRERYRETEAFLAKIPQRILQEGLQTLSVWLEPS